MHYIRTILDISFDHGIRDNVLYGTVRDMAWMNEKLDYLCNWIIFLINSSFFSIFFLLFGYVCFHNAGLGQNQGVGGRGRKPWKFADVLNEWSLWCIFIMAIVVCT